VPRLIALTARRSNGQWHVQLEGTVPPATLAGGSAESVMVSLSANEPGSLVAKVDHEATQLGIDSSSQAPDAPYTLAFSGDPGLSGCAVVWLEIPFPSGKPSRVG
jgi:hypothetical protein